MRAQVLHQRLGEGPTREALADVLSGGSFTRLRILMAFCRGSGLGLIVDALERFIQGGATVEAIVGLDLGGTSPDAVRTLMELGAETYVFGVAGDRTFHPKVAILTRDDTDYAVLVGSQNWTPGGLDSNFEVGVRLDLRRGRSGREDALIDEFEALWRFYRHPRPPLKSANLKRVTRSLLDSLEPALPADHRRTPDQARSEISDELFPPVVAPRAPIVRPRRRPSDNPPTLARKRGLARRLLLEVTGPETGQGREIQVPKASLEEFFGIAPEDVLYMTFIHRDGTTEENRPLASYANQTYRISSSRFPAVPRPSIVELARARKPDTFRVLIHRPTSSAQALLTRGGGQSKRWGIR